MTVKIALRLRGIDLRSVEAYERLPEELGELSFESNGAISVAVVYSDGPDATAEALQWARLIVKAVPGVAVDATYEELVSVSDIALRCEVGAEAVRLWVTGKRRSGVRPFPLPAGVVGSSSGSRSMNVYAWADVLGWVREVLRIDPDEGITYLDARQRARLNAGLAGLVPEDLHIWSGAVAMWRPMATRWQMLDNRAPRILRNAEPCDAGYSRLLARTDELLGSGDSRPVPAQTVCR